MSKTIEIKKATLLIIPISLIIGFALLFTLEHFGTFSYITDYRPDAQAKPSFTYYVDSNSGVTSIMYRTYFNKEVMTSGNGFNVGDLNFSETEFNKYTTKIYYYTEATKEDYLYGLMFSGAIFLILLFFSYFKIKFK